MTVPYLNYGIELTYEVVMEPEGVTGEQRRTRHPWALAPRHSAVAATTLHSVWNYVCVKTQMLIVSYSGLASQSGLVLFVTIY